MRKSANGNGSVYKLSGRRKKPWTVYVTTGFEIINGKAQQNRKYIGYYETKAEAQKALADYQLNPNLYINAEKTFESVYNEWYKQQETMVKPNTLKGYVTAFNTCTTLYKMPFKKLTFEVLQACIDTIESGTTKKQVKTLFSMMYEYAILRDITTPDRNKCRYLNIKGEIARNPHTRFTNTELQTLWDNETMEFADIVLMLCYCGLRVDCEFLKLTKADIDLQERSINIRDSKTKAGIRKVPIAKKTLHLWEKYYNACSDDNAPLVNISYFYCKQGINALSTLLEKRHTMHDTRHTTTSLLADAHIDKSIQHAILGHKGDDTTEIVYTHHDFSILIEAIDQI